VVVKGSSICADLADAAALLVDAGFLVGGAVGERDGRSRKTTGSSGGTGWTGG
jgi:hypothetical protein